MTREDEIANFLQNLKDIQSGLKVLQSAVKNEFAPPELSDIENSLEMLLCNFSNQIQLAEKIF